MGELKLNRNKNYKQGYFYPSNPEKFVSKERYAVYRSGLELDYFKILDKNPNVLKWGSEEIVIPYFFEGKWHKYYVDLFVIFKNGNKLVKYLVELKPHKQTQEPVWSKRRKESTYLYECFQWQQNKAKWQAALEVAKKNDFEFKILTEKDLETYR